MKLQGLALEQWRDYFKKAKSDIFDIIEHAISVAALDYPTEFILQRDQIAEKLFTFTSAARCSGCDCVDSSLSDNAGVSKENKLVVIDNAGGSKANKLVVTNNAGGSKESKASDISSGTGDDPLVIQFASNVSYEHAEALTDEIEREAGIVGEVLRIKDVLLNGQDESESELLDSLRRLELMTLTVDNLKATQIGKSVNRLRKHSSKQIRQLAQTLIVGWKEMVDACFSATEAIVGHNVDTPESVNPTVVVEEVGEEAGLPCPPLDEAFLCSIEFTSMDFLMDFSMDFSKFFDGMDEDESPHTSAECKKNRDSGRKSSQENHNLSEQKQQTSREANMVVKDDKSQQMKSLEPVAKPNNKPSNTNTGFGRPTRNNMEQKPKTELKLVQKSDKMAAPKMSLSSQQYELKTSDELSVQRKLEHTKRKLQERYQQAENAKKRRTIQVMELHELPSGHKKSYLKLPSGHKKAYLKLGNRNRQSTKIHLGQ